MLEQPNKGTQHHQPVDEGEVSTAESAVNWTATLVCCGLVARYLGRPVGIVGYVVYLPIVTIVGNIAAYISLLVFGVLFAAYVKYIWRLPVSPDLEMFTDEANAILFPQSSEAKGVAQRRSCEVDHLVYTCSDLDEGIAFIKKVTGVKAAYGGKHPKFGTHNALISLGNGSYLEIIAPDPNREYVGVVNLFGLDRASNINRLSAFAVHPDSSVKGATFELIAQSMYLGGYTVGVVEAGERQSPNGKSLQWRFTSPSCSRWTQPFVIDWGNTRSPALTAPSGCKLLRLIFFCKNDEEMKVTTQIHERIGLRGRVPIAVEKSGDGLNYMVAEISTPKGQKVCLGAMDTKVKDK